MNTYRHTWLVAASLCLGTAACGSSQFGGSTGTARQAVATNPAPSESATAPLPSQGAGAKATAQASATSGGVAVAAWQPDSPQGQSVKGCLTNLGILSLPQAALDGIRVLADSSFSPFANDVITDDQVTAGPAVVFVQVSGFGPVVNFDLNLLNPNGIYCIDSSSFAVFTNRQITMCKSGKIGTDQQANMSEFTSGNTLRVGCN